METKKIDQKPIKLGNKLWDTLNDNQKSYICKRLNIEIDILKDRLCSGEFDMETYLLSISLLDKQKYTTALKYKLPWSQKGILTWDQDKFGARRVHNKLLGIFSRDELSEEEQLRIEHALKSTLSIPQYIKIQLIKLASQISTETLLKFADSVDVELKAIEKQILFTRAKKKLFINDTLENRIEKCIDEWRYIEDGFINKGEYIQTTDNQNDLYPFAIVNRLSNTIIGQNEALKKVATTLYYHKKIHRAISKQLPLPFSPLRPMLIAGQTGSGKTFMIQKACELMNIPFIHIDASSMVSTGIRGNSFDEVAKNIIRVSNYDINAAQSSVVVFDEVDKLLDSYYGESIMSQMLHFIEGTQYPIEKQPINDEFKDIKFLDTSNIMFIFSGSFQALVDAENQYKQSGFIKNDNSSINKEEQYLKSIEKSGLKKELLGRIDDIIVLKSLGEKEYRQILLESDESPIKKYRQMLKFVGTKDYIPSEKEIDSIVKEAKNSPYGARTLHKLVKKLYAQKMYDIHQKDNNEINNLEEFEKSLRVYIGLVEPDKKDED